jgi:hypothetical protein
MHATKKPVYDPSTSLEPAPTAIPARRRRPVPSVMAPVLAAAAQDVTSPTPPVSTNPAVPSNGAASAAATPTPTQPLPIGVVPVVSSPTPLPLPVVGSPVGTSALPGVVSPPPDDDIPSVPTDFVPPNYHDFLGFHPSSRELDAAAQAIVDLQRFSDYVTVLGSAAPPAAALAAALTLGTEWRSMRNATQAWDEYARAQDAKAWKNALTLVDELKPLFLNAVVKNARLASQYPGLTQMFDAQKASARQGIATRKKNAKAKADAAAPAAQAAGTAAQSADAAVTTAAASTTTGKTITVHA